MPSTEYEEKKLQTSTEILSIKHGEIGGDMISSCGCSKDTKLSIMCDDCRIKYGFTTNDLKITVYSSFHIDYLEFVAKVDFRGQNITIESFKEFCEKLGYEVIIN